MYTDKTVEAIMVEVLVHVNGWDRKKAVETAHDNKGTELWTEVSNILQFPDSGVDIIAAERERHFTEEGWTIERDVKLHTDGQLAEAASCYAAFATSIQVPIENVFSNHVGVHKVAEALVGTDAIMLVEKTHRWPWDKKWWKPTPENRIKELAKAGALIAAEIDRLQNS